MACAGLSKAVMLQLSRSLIEAARAHLTKRLDD